jgi:hypothetical protein
MHLIYSLGGGKSRIKFKFRGIFKSLFYTVFTVGPWPFSVGSKAENQVFAGFAVAKKLIY